MNGIIDRFEGDYAVIEVEKGLTVDVPLKQVHSDCKENDVVKLVDGIWVPDAEETKQRSAKIKSLMENVWED